MRAREVCCKSAVVKSGIPGVDFVLNPYIGCEHGCVYCYASFMTRFRPHAEPWGRFVDVKVNFPQVLRRELRRESRREPRTELRRLMHGEILLSSVTDPYQPAEAQYGITRECLQILEAVQDSRLRAGILPCAGVEEDPVGEDPVAEGPVREDPAAPHVSILTKSDLVTRDAGVLSRMRSVKVGMTITTVDDGLSRMFEPRAPNSSRRLKALEDLASKGVYTWAFAAPLIPYYSDGAESLMRLFSGMRDAGVKKILVDKMNMYPACVNGVARACRGDDRAIRRLEWAKRDRDGYEAALRSSIAEAQAGAGCHVEVVF